MILIFMSFGLSLVAHATAVIMTTTSLRGNLRRLDLFDGPAPSRLYANFTYRYLKGDHDPVWCSDASDEMLFVRDGGVLKVLEITGIGLVPRVIPDPSIAIVRAQTNFQGVECNILLANGSLAVITLSQPIEIDLWIDQQFNRDPHWTYAPSLMTFYGTIDSAVVVSGPVIAKNGTVAVGFNADATPNVTSISLFPGTRVVPVAVAAGTSYVLWSPQASLQTLSSLYTLIAAQPIRYTYQRRQWAVGWVLLDFFAGASVVGQEPLSLQYVSSLKVGPIGFNNFGPIVRTFVQCNDTLVFVSQAVTMQVVFDWQGNVASQSTINATAVFAGGGCANQN